MVLEKSPFVKYWKAIKASPPGIYNARLFLTVFTYALSGGPKGWDEGSASAITSLKSFQNTFGITPKGNPGPVSNIVSFVNLGCGIGALLSYLTNDRLGRRWALRAYTMIVCAGVLISTVSYGSLAALYVGRLLAGVGIGALTVTGPMSIVEIAPRLTRGLMTLWFNLAMLGSQTIGVFVCYGCTKHISDSKNLQWQVPWFVQFFVPLIAFVLSFFIEESPRWLCLVGRTDEALETLARLRGYSPEDPNLHTEFESINGPIQRELEEFGKETLASSARETFTVRSNLRRVQLTIVAYILAQMSGANSITNYLPTIFGYVGISSSSAAIDSSAFYALTKWGCTLLASLFFVDAVGRRKSLMMGICIQLFCQTYIGSYLNRTTGGHHVSEGASQMAIAAIYIHAFGWSIGLYGLPYLFGAELWPNRIRSFGGALSSGFHWLFLFAITKATPSMFDAMDKWGAFIFFAAWCFISLIYTFIMVPETSGRSLESMNQLFEHHWYEMRKYAYEDTSSQIKEPSETATSDTAEPETIDEKTTAEPKQLNV